MSWLIIELHTNYRDGYYHYKGDCQRVMESLSREFPLGDFIMAKFRRRDAQRSLYHMREAVLISHNYEVMGRMLRR